MTSNPIDIPIDVAPGGLVAVPGLGFVAAPAAGATCPDCGSARFAVTNRRVACLPCYVTTRGSSMDRKTRLYPEECVCGYLDTVAMVVRLDREVVPWRPEGADDAAEAQALDTSAVDRMLADDEQSRRDRAEALEAIRKHVNRSDSSIYMNVGRVETKGDAFERTDQVQAIGGTNVRDSGRVKPTFDPVKWDPALGRFVKKSEREVADRARARKKRPGRRPPADAGPSLFSGPEGES